MTVPRIGFTFTAMLAPERLRPAALAAEAAGLDEFWLWEDCFSESGIASAAAVLAWTERIDVKIGLLPVPLRNVTLTAMEIATLDRLFPGRFTAGIGHGVQDWMGQAGARADSPMTLLREHAAVLRRLLNGERVTVAGRYVQLTDVALDWPPQQPPALLMGGYGPKTLALSAAVADGVMLPGSHPLAQVRAHVATISEAAAQAGRTGPSDITTTVIAATGADAPERIGREAAAWDKEAVAGVAVQGGPEDVADVVRQLAELGITAVTFQSARDEPDLETLCRVIGEARDLLHAAS